MWDYSKNFVCCVVQGSPRRARIKQGRRTKQMMTVQQLWDLNQPQGCDILKWRTIVCSVKKIVAIFYGSQSFARRHYCYESKLWIYPNNRTIWIILTKLIRKYTIHNWDYFNIPNIELKYEEEIIWSKIFEYFIFEFFRIISDNIINDNNRNVGLSNNMNW